MKISIIGSGRIGGTLARLFVRAGYEVAISNSRGPESLKGFVAELGEKAKAMSVDAASAYGNVIVLASPWIKTEALPDPGIVKGKIVVDAMNPYNPGGSVIDLSPSTSSEETARRLPGANIVKAFNTISYVHLGENGNTALPVDQRQAIFLAGDDEDAKRVVSGLIEAIGFAPVDTGSLHEGGVLTAPGAILYARKWKAGEVPIAVRKI